MRLIFTHLFLFISLIIADTIDTIDLITTNDFHGSIAEQKAYFMNPQYPPTMIGGSGYYNYIKNNIDSDTSLILDGGNFFQGHPMAVIDSGKTMIEFMNKVKYTALVPGPDDFVYGADNLNSLAELSDFPFLTSNIECNNCPLTSDNFKKFLIKEINNTKIGIIGIVDAGLDLKVDSDNINGISIIGIKESLEYWIPKLEEISDILIILTSAGVPWDREILYNDFIDKIKLNKQQDFRDLNAIEMGLFSSGVDIIVSGGISKGYREPWRDPNSGSIILQNYGNGTSFGHILLKIINHNFTGYEMAVKGNPSQSLLLDDFDPDIEMRNWINEKNNNSLNLLYENFKYDNISYSNNHIEVNNIVQDTWPFPRLGLDANFDIITWNCEFFPTADNETIIALGEAINDFDVDVIAFQEIKKIGWFSELMKYLPNYDYILSDHSSFMHQAIIYKKNEFSLVRKLEPFSDNDYNFAGRPPLRADLFRYSDSTYYSIIDLHMKCCDSGLNRRKEAVKMLYDYVISDVESGHSNFIILGDWNDDLKDNWGEHCFNPFLEDEKFYFVNSEIVYDQSQATYPKEPYVSFLDHILITESLLPKDSDYLIKTIKMGEYMGGYNKYEELISDHLPVFLSFKR